MTLQTTMKISPKNREDLRRLAEADGGLTLDQELTRLIRRAKQRRMAEQMASWSPTTEEEMLLDAGGRDTAEFCGDIER